MSSARLKSISPPLCLGVAHQLPVAHSCRVLTTSPPEEGLVRNSVLLSVSRGSGNTPHLAPALPPARQSDKLGRVAFLRGDGHVWVERAPGAGSAAPHRCPANPPTRAKLARPISIDSSEIR